MSSEKRDHIFSYDEMELRKVDPAWGRDNLLEAEGIFYLKDVAKKLRISALQLKKKAQKLMEEGKNPWEEMGIQKVWTHWIVRMTVFAPYLRGNMLKIREINAAWDGNILLSQKGFFFLVDVCKFIPFTTNQIRYHAHRNPNSRHEFGVWKDDYLNAFVVDMEQFSLWIKKLWLDGFHT